MRLVFYAVVYSVIVVILSSLFTLWAFARSDEQSVMDKKVRESAWESSALTMPILLTYVEPKKRKINAIVTAYSSSPDETDDTPTITAFGTTTREGIVANNCLRFGSVVTIHDNRYVVEDRKNKRYGCEWFDIWMLSRAAAVAHGIQKKEVVIYE